MTAPADTHLVPDVDAVLDTYREFMRALLAERSRRGDDPWHACPMTMPQLRALNLIAASNRGLSSRELAATLNVGPSAITPLVDRLVEHGFVERHEDRHDRRITRLQATANGALALERMQATQTDLMRRLLAQLDPEQLSAVSTALDVLHVALEQVTLTPLTSPPAEGMPV